MPEQHPPPPTHTHTHTQTHNPKERYIIAERVRTRVVVVVVVVREPLFKAAAVVSEPALNLPRDSTPDCISGFTPLAFPSQGNTCKELKLLIHSRKGMT